MKIHTRKNKTTNKLNLARWKQKHSYVLLRKINPIIPIYVQSKNALYIPFPGTSKIPHNLQPTERMKQTSGRRTFNSEDALHGF